MHTSETILKKKIIHQLKKLKKELQFIWTCLAETKSSFLDSSRFQLKWYFLFIPINK